MANGRCGPNVVHGPNHGFAAVHDFSDAAEREHSLVNPREVDNVGLLKLG